jgi:UDP-perosamine 4-acetyltransferase
MSLPVIVIGAGGHAKVLIDSLLRSSVTITGIVDPSPELKGKELLGVAILGGDEIVDTYRPTEILLVNGLGSVGIPAKRREIYDTFKAKGYSFAPVVHPSAIIATDVVISEGAQIMAGAVIQPGSCIGSNAIINTRASVDHDCTIGDHVHVAPGVTVSGGVSIGDGSHVGTGVTLIQGVSLGRSCLVAAGAVVIKNIVDGGMVRGVPAREFV